MMNTLRDEFLTDDPMADSSDTQGTTPEDIRQDQAVNTGVEGIKQEYGIKEGDHAIGLGDEDSKVFWTWDEKFY
jgi:hypothetical protein